MWIPFPSKPFDENVSWTSYDRISWGFTNLNQYKPLGIQTQLVLLTFAL